MQIDKLDLQPKRIIMGEARDEDPRKILGFRNQGGTYISYHTLDDEEQVMKNKPHKKK